VAVGWICANLLLGRAQQETDNDALAQRAVEAERRGDFAGAASAFQQLIANGADSPELRNNLGIVYFQLHDYGQALRQFRLALSKDNKSVPANLFSGLSLLKLQRPKEAIPLLRTARQAQPSSPDIVLALAQAEIAVNEIGQARRLYEEATRLNGENAEAWYGLGISERVLAEERLKAAGAGSARRESQKLMDASNAALARAVQLEPDGVGAYMILGESFRIAERYDEAVAEYQAATRQKPDFAPAWAGLAVAYSAAGNDDQALKAATRAVSLDAEDAGTNALIAGTYLRQGDSEKAKPFALRALALQPDLSAGHVVLAKIYLEEHQPEKALPELRHAVKDDADGSMYYLLATTLRQLGNQREAAAAMQKYKQLHAAHVGPAERNP